MTTGFGVEPDVLGGAASKMRDAVSAVDSSKVEGLPGGADVYGSDELFGAFEEFCSAVKIGVDVLVGNVESTATSLGEVVQNYLDSDTSASNELNGVANHVAAVKGEGV